MKEIVIKIDDDKNIDKLKNSAKSKNTKDKYLGDWKKFCSYTKKYLNFNPEDKKIKISKESLENTLTKYIAWLKEEPDAKKLKGHSEITNRKHMKAENEDVKNENSTSPTLNNELKNLVSTNYKKSTLLRKIASIKYFYKIHRDIKINTQNEHLIEIIKGISEEYRDKKELGKKKALEIFKDDLKNIIDAIPEDNNLTNIRDKAMILLGWWSACRRSEIVNLEVGDVKFFEKDGYITIYLKYSKIDRDGEGETKILSYDTNSKYCPGVALKKWLDASMIDNGPLFYKIRKVKKDEDVDSPSRVEKYINKKKGKKISLSDAWFVNILKERAKASGIEEEKFKKISGHSLRRGFISQASEEEFDNDSIKLASGQKDSKTVDGYKEIYDKKSKSPAMLIKIN